MNANSSTVFPFGLPSHRTPTSNQSHEKLQLQFPLLPPPWIPKAPFADPSLPKHTTELSLAIKEVQSLLSLAIPMAANGLLLYSRSIISMLFLGHLGPLPLAGGSLAIGFANITGYSLLSGLAAGMDPICGQAAGARQKALFLPFRRTILLLLAASLPIALAWSFIRSLLLLFGQPEDITLAAESYLLCCLPDLFFHSILHPLRIFLRSQSITLPLAYSAAIALFLHIPTNYLFVSLLGLGIRGVALSAVITNLNITLFLLAYVHLSGLYNHGINSSADDRREFKCGCGALALISLALPSCVSVCLEWWWYEIMVLLCGRLLDPRSTVASMGILIQTTSLIYIFPSSLSFGISTRVSNELGAGRPESARRSASIGVACGAGLGCVAFCFALAVRGKWAKMFTADAEIAELTACVMLVLGLCELGNCPQTAGCGALRGSARPRIGVKINVWAFYGIGMPVASGLAFWAGWGFRGLWMGLLAAQGTCLALMLLVLRRTDWRMEAERAQRLVAGEAILRPLKKTSMNNEQ
ncbi:protein DETOXIFICATION 49-like [Phalaenopsis equestris]|uniref:protein DETOXIFICATION 49-like n=1 Tax=Phalaenopsis equestris TaxID=78828 RepID=UPI0009E52CAF|nr:protein DETOXIFICATION 49-like [Phalaenopsis equestris]